MNKILAKSFLWMFGGLLVTFLTGYGISLSSSMVNAIYDSSLYIVFALIELALVIFLSVRVFKMKPTTAKVIFLLYSFVSGLTFSSIFIYFKITSIMLVFLVAAVMFGVFGLIGYNTNLDLTKISTFLLMGLLGVLVATLINVFVGNSTFDLIITIISILVFLGYTAYDVQKLKFSSGDDDALAIYGALQLYLDFINIFIDLLSVIGDSKD